MPGHGFEDPAWSKSFLLPSPPTLLPLLSSPTLCSSHTGFHQALLPLGLCTCCSFIRPGMPFLNFLSPATATCPVILRGLSSLLSHSFHGCARCPPPMRVFPRLLVPYTWYCNCFLICLPRGTLKHLGGREFGLLMFQKTKNKFGGHLQPLLPGLLVLSGFFLTPNSSMEKQTPLTQEATLRVAAPALPTLLRCNSPECTGPSSPALLCTQSEGWVEQRRCKVGQVPLGYFIPQCLLSVRMPQVCVDLPLLHASATLSTYIH